MPDSRRSPRSSASPTGSSSASPSGRLILVVDDEPAIRRLVAQILRGRGHEVVMAAGGREALRAVYERSDTPDVVVADIGLPDISGVELAARLSADRPAIRIVLMTGEAGSAETARDRSQIVSAVILKPFDADELTRAVDAALASAPPE